MCIGRDALVDWNEWTGLIAQAHIPGGRSLSSIGRLVNFGLGQRSFFIQFNCFRNFSFTRFNFVAMVFRSKDNISAISKYFL